MCIICISVCINSKIHNTLKHKLKITFRKINYRAKVDKQHKNVTIEEETKKYLILRILQFFEN